MLPITLEMEGEPETFFVGSVASWVAAPFFVTILLVNHKQPIAFAK